MRYLLFERKFKKQRISLDIGCGGSNKATVNLDLYIEKSKHRSYNLKIRKIRNFIIADAQQLPIRDKVFQSTRCSHVLEHLPNPMQGLKEMNRVCKNTSIICVPSALNFHDKTKGHLYTWNPFTLNNLLNQIFKQSRIIVTPYELIGFAICH